MGRYFRTASPRHIDYWYRPPLEAMERATMKVDKRTDAMLNSIDNLDLYLQKKKAEKGSSSSSASIGVNYTPADAQQAQAKISKYEEQIDNLAKGLIGDVLNPGKYETKYRELRSDIRQDILGGELAAYAQNKEAFDTWKKSMKDAKVDPMLASAMSAQVMNKFASQKGTNYNSETGEYNTIELPNVVDFDFNEALKIASKEKTGSNRARNLEVANFALEEAGISPYLQQEYSWFLDKDKQEQFTIDEYVQKQKAGYAEILAEMLYKPQSSSSSRGSTRDNTKDTGIYTHTVHDAVHDDFLHELNNDAPVKGYSYTHLKEKAVENRDKPDGWIKLNDYVADKYQDYLIKLANDAYTNGYIDKDTYESLGVQNEAKDKVGRVIGGDINQAGINSFATALAEMNVEDINDFYNVFDLYKVASEVNDMYNAKKDVSSGKTTDKAVKYSTSDYFKDNLLTADIAKAQYDISNYNKQELKEVQKNFAKQLGDVANYIDANIKLTGNLEELLPKEMYGSNLTVEELIHSGVIKYNDNVLDLKADVDKSVADLAPRLSSKQEKDRKEIKPGEAPNDKVKITIDGVAGGNKTFEFKVDNDKYTRIVEFEIDTKERDLDKVKKMIKTDYSGQLEVYKATDGSIRAVTVIPSAKSYEKKNTFKNFKVNSKNTGVTMIDGRMYAMTNISLDGVPGSMYVEIGTKGLQTEIFNNKTNRNKYFASDIYKKSATLLEAGTTNKVFILKDDDSGAYMKKNDDGDYVLVIYDKDGETETKDVINSIYSLLNSQ